MARKVNPASDPAHKETDRLIAKLEKKIKHIYSEAYGNAVEKFTSYMAAFDVKDRAHRADVSAGRWTEQEYKDWKRNQLLYGDTLAKIRDTLAVDLHKADKMAIQMVRDQQVDVYALNHNYGTYEIEHGLGVDTTYTLYDHDTVERLVKENPKLLPKPSAKRQREIDAKDIAWNQQHLSSAFTASILSGDDIPTMATRIASVAEMDRHAAVRNARTMCTGAENGGRLRAYNRAQGMGINVKQQWVATLDSRTRDSHRIVDGEIIRVGEKFSNGLRFPGDPDGPAAETYNCRCCTVAVVNGIDPMAFDKTDVLQRKLENTEITYEKWKTEHLKGGAGQVEVDPHEQAMGIIKKHGITGKSITDDIKNFDEQTQKDIRDHITYGIKQPSGAWWRRYVNGKNTDIILDSIISGKKLELDDDVEKVINELTAKQVDYVAPKKYDIQPKESDIIKSISGGDMTRGSCSSCAFAFIANKGGYNIKDFRDGNSRFYFAQDANIKKIAKFNGVNADIEYTQNEMEDTYKFLKGIENGKEWYMATGRHAAIVKKDEDGNLLYLELQSPDDKKNGWRPFGIGENSIKDVLFNRFGVKYDKSTKEYYQLSKIDVDSLAKNDNFAKIIGYINTAEKDQKKGVSGSVR